MSSKSSEVREELSHTSENQHGLPVVFHVHYVMYTTTSCILHMRHVHKGHAKPHRISLFRLQDALVQALELSLQEC
jgi:hypothetical protein